MGTKQNTGTAQTVAKITKPPKCSICRQIIKDTWWRQGRCPHHPSMLDNILSDPYRSRFYNLINFFKGK
jgi:hypothetical protein